MTLKLYNTMSRQVEPFEPLTPSKAALYACGPTVYDDAHIGHLKASVSFDILVRHLKYLGYEVDYVRNFTDIDDKIINRAKERNQDWKDLGNEYIKRYNEDLEQVSCLPPDHCPKATEYINDMIKDIQQLINSGHAYALNGDVYFDISSLKDYGKLSGRSMEDQEAGARVAVNEDKKNPGDFALWKTAKADEPHWPSPWGNGRPGWHIECSTMSDRLLGASFDIHGGGQDLIFPHHENEIAQSEALGRPMAKYWFHNGLIRVNNEKMSKSLGNFFTARDVLKIYSPEVLRFFLVSKHYRSPLDFSEESMQEAEKALERIYRALAAAEDFMGDDEAIPFDANTFNEFKQLYEAAMNDDLNTAKALGIAFDAARALNKAVTAKDMKQTAALYGVLNLIGDSLGLWKNSPEDFFNSLKKSNSQAITPEEVEELIKQRSQARANKDWAEADRLRQELSSKGVSIEDHAEGVSWRYN